MLGNRFARTTAVAVFAGLALTALPAAAQDATPTATPEPPPNCPVLEDQPSNMRTGYYMGEGIAYLNANRLREAEFSFTCVIRVIDPAYMPAYLARAEVYVNLRDFENAMEDYNNALQMEPGSIVARNNRGIVLTIIGDYETAAADFDRVLQEDPDYMPGYNNRSIIYTLQGDYDAAIELINEGIQRSGAAEALVEARDEERPSDILVEVDSTGMRLYALRGILESARALESFNSYLDLANASGRFADERITTAGGSIESRLTFDLRLDDGTWMIRSNYLSESQ